MEEQRMLILYGSQTGTAEDVAERIGREAERYLFKPSVHSLDTFPIARLVTEHLVVFVVATTGQGDEPDNMEMFWKFILRKSLPTNSLEGMDAAVLGLGDSSYQQYNVVGKRLHRRLSQLGAQMLLPLGLADDQHSLGADAMVDPWVQQLFNLIINKYPLPKGCEILSSDLIPSPKYEVIPVSKEDMLVPSISNGEVIHQYNAQHPFIATIKDNRRVTSPDHFQDVRLISFSTVDSSFKFLPGDVLMVEPRNTDDVVEEFLALFPSINPDESFLVQHRVKNDLISLPSIFTKPCTLRECAEKYLDIQSVPRRSFFEFMFHFASEDSLHKEKLQELSTSQGQEDRILYCNRPKRTIIEVLNDFLETSAHVPLQYILDLIPPLRPRAFSIASSQKHYQNEVHILVAVVHYKTQLVKWRRGVCSTWLSTLKDGDKANVWIKKGTLRPKGLEVGQTFQLDVPTLMIGPGTGCAPFRSLIQEVAYSSAPHPFLAMLFGCRNENKDFFFKDEWLELMEKGILWLKCAFSRDQPEKRYVQHILEEHSEQVYKWLQADAYILVAGNSNQMPTDVRDSLLRILVTGGETNEQADARLNRLQKEGRYLQETWS